MPNRDFERQISGLENSSNRTFSLLRAMRIDLALFLLLLALTCFGLIVLYSAADQNMDILFSQIRKFAISYAAMLLIAQIPPRFYQRLSPVFYIISLCFLIAVLVLGTESKGAQRWIIIPGLPRFQPSEFMKLLMPMMINA